MKLNDRQEEILETLWVHTEQREKPSMDLGVARGEPEIDGLVKQGYIRVANDKIVLTDKGKAQGRSIVRRHRLAERLFADVLDVKKQLVHSISCRFEHLIHEEIEENICVLLGHPKTCPHGQPIPQGECCKKATEKIGKVISSLADMRVNQKGKVAYLQTKDPKQLQKLMAMGILPGASIMLLQKFPSHVFQVGQSQFAIDKELAEPILVRTNMARS
jgi:DtxR family transcriptional regulator, Mn-dependent transcriptional regulator